MNKQNIIALIPARGGSKGLNKKNIALLNGRPLIDYTIMSARKSKLINRIVVSSDDEVIIKITKKAGAEVPFQRPKNISQDNTSDLPVIRHALNWLSENEGKYYDYLVYLRPTSPLRPVGLIDDCLKKFMASTLLTSLRTVTEVKASYHPYWMYKNDNGLLRPFIKSINTGIYYQRQLLPKCYRPNGLVDILRVSRIDKTLFGNYIGFVEVDSKFSYDIDNKFDLETCEHVMKKYSNNLFNE